MPDFHSSSNAKAQLIKSMYESSARLQTLSTEIQDQFFILTEALQKLRDDTNGPVIDRFENRVNQCRELRNQMELAHLFYEIRDHCEVEYRKLP